MTGWADYLACEVCEAKMGGPCFTLLSGGPEALPPRYAEVPHSSRKVRGAEPARPRIPRAAGSATPVARRSAAKTRSTAKSWADVARKQGKI